MASQPGLKASQILQMTGSVAELKEKWTKAGQGHVFAYFDTLSSEQQDKLIKQVRSIDITLVNKIYKELKEGAAPTTTDVKPFTGAVSIPNPTSAEYKRWLSLGLDEIAAGRVAVLVLAGGQGTRLGTDDPKGMYPLGLPSGNTLYSLQALRILATQNLVAQRTGTPSVTIPWYIMTSFATEEPTRRYFETNKFFGLDPEQVIFFNQDLFPCVFEDGRVILKAQHKISVAPNGNGGLWSALNTTGALADMEKRGVKLVCSYPVDNILCKVADPVYIGFCVEKKIDVACKVVAKAYPTERVGVLAWKDGKPAVIEYTEIDEKQATSTDPVTGVLLYNASHTVLNNFSIDFMKKIADPRNENLHKLPYHIAKKKIPYLGDDGKSTVTDGKVGWKFELFIFDVFEHAQNMQAFEMSRDEEYAPLKNSDKEKTDNPTTCRRAIYKLHKGWLSQAGAKLCDDSDDAVCEISPVASVDGSGLEKFNGAEVRFPFQLNAGSEKTQ